MSVWTRGCAPAPKAVPAPSLPPRYRFCRKCEQILLLGEFRDGIGGRYRCRGCFREYFQRRGELHLRQVKAARHIRRRRAKVWLTEVLLRSACTDCGETDPVILEFDHLGNKKAAVSQLVHQGYAIAKLEAEAAKCEVVCVNCHRRRTCRRAGWRRLDGDHPERVQRLPAVERNYAVAYAHLAKSGCVDCGEEDLVVLKFDHVGYKTAGVLSLADEGYSLARLKAEMAQCEVRCANCHRRRTRAGGRSLSAKP